MNWQVVRIWEHELKNPEKALRRLRKALNANVLKVSYEIYNTGLAG